MGFSIIVPVKAINDYIRESVPIALGLDYEAFEIIVVPNDPPPELPGALRHPKVRIIPSGRVSPAVKRDLAAGQARYENLAFIDDDAYPRRDWLRVAERLMREQGVACLGGPGVTPPGSTLRERASGLFYETWIGGGGKHYRYVPVQRAFPVDDLPTVNLIVSKRAFDAVGGFDNAFWPGEDTKFCLDLVKAGHTILYSPELVVWHHRRKVFRPHLKQIANYGLHRGHFARVHPRTSLRPTYLAPSAFLLGNLGLLGGALIDARLSYVWAALIALYFALALVDVFSRTRHPALGLLTVATILLSHLTYGAMFLRGLLTPKLRSELR
ncbi:MAG: glycosyltransferase [Candidatus Lambdaproteobacteria bacterium]|nr:glycosyltransferase [Candidatus Lambdaproteobacteria bacterium]